MNEAMKSKRARRRKPRALIPSLFPVSCFLLPASCPPSYGGELTLGFSIALKMAGARASSASRIAMSSSCFAVTPNAFRMESRWRARDVLSIVPTGSRRKAIIVLM
jgi:hypothetical protein